MNATGKRRLLKLAAFLDTMPREKFDFSSIGYEGGKPMEEALEAGRTRCGTAACAIGWTPAVFPRLVRWKRHREALEGITVCRVGDARTTDFEAAEEIFGISHTESTFLFDPGIGPLPGDATAKRVARHIRAFVRDPKRAARWIA